MLEACELQRDDQQPGENRRESEQQSSATEFVRGSDG
jgi:hypothetical protein